MTLRLSAIWGRNVKVDISMLILWITLSAFLFWGSYYTIPAPGVPYCIAIQTKVSEWLVLTWKVAEANLSQLSLSLSRIATCLWVELDRSTKAWSWNSKAEAQSPISPFRQALYIGPMLFDAIVLVMTITRAVHLNFRAGMLGPVLTTLLRDGILWVNKSLEEKVFSITWLTHIRSREPSFDSYFLGTFTVNLLVSLARHRILKSFLV